MIFAHRERITNAVKSPTVEYEATTNSDCGVSSVSDATRVAVPLGAFGLDECTRACEQTPKCTHFTLESDARALKNDAKATTRSCWPKTTTCAATPTDGIDTHTKKTVATRVAREWHGNRDFLSLRHHWFGCSTKPMSGFSLESNSAAPNQLRAVTDCMLTAPEIGQVKTWKATGFNSHGNNNMVFLDRHKASCGAKPMTHLQLHLHADKIRWQYRCGDASPDYTECEDVKSKLVPESKTWPNNGRYTRLEPWLESPVVCPAGKAVTQLRKIRNGNPRSHTIWTKCCKPPAA